MKWTFIALCTIIVGIQLIPVKQTNPEVAYDFDGPAQVKAILKRSCYDCHSNETAWPWYSHAAPASWLVAHHVEDGRKHLNFSEWEALKAMGWIRNEIVEEVSEGKMPPKSYLFMHPGAKVTAQELSVLKEWAGAQGP
jgi:hypothetical protein